jgi:hypothetical protein
MISGLAHLTKAAINTEAIDIQITPNVPASNAVSATALKLCRRLG